MKGDLIYEDRSALIRKKHDLSEACGLGDPPCHRPFV